jgi:multicomponent Na+:H+ antiporter subunit D
MAGLGRQMPITFSAFTLGALGLAGTPLFVGFLSKWNLGLGALHAGHGVFLAVLVTSGLLNFAYFFPIIYNAFFGQADQPIAYHEAPRTLWIPLAVTAVCSVILGLYPDAGWHVYELAWKAADSAISYPSNVLAGEPL